jgi:hypothetical protein
MKFHRAHRLTEKQPGTNHYVLMLRIGVGYWPCLRAPFIQLALGKHKFDFWYGLPSYLRLDYPVTGGGYR